MSLLRQLSNYVFATANGDMTPGQTYNVELNAVGTAGTSDWSGPGELMII